MAGKEAPEKIDEYSNNKGYTRKQIDDFNSERVMTIFSAIIQDDGADIDLKTGDVFFSERQKRQAAVAHENGDDPDLVKEGTKEVEERKALAKSCRTALEQQTQRPPEPQMLFDGIHKGKYVYISKEGKTRIKKIVFPTV